MCFFKNKKRKQQEEIMMKAMALKGMQDAKTDAEKNESIFESYEDGDLTIGERIERPIFFRGKSSRDEYIKKIEELMHNEYKLNRRYFMSSDDVNGTVDGCEFKNGSDDSFMIYASIYSHHDMSDYIPRIVKDKI